MDYYTGKYRPRQTTAPLRRDDDKPKTGALAAGASSAVQNLTNLLPLPYMNPSVVSSGGDGNGSAGGVETEAEAEADPGAGYQIPPPRTAFSSFIDHADEFIVFLEACLKEKKVARSDRCDLYTTLFEMYLHKASEAEEKDERDEWEAKARRLIEGEDIPMESSNLLLLSHLSGFRDGTTLVKEQAGLLLDIFRSYTSAKDTRGALKALKRYGPDERQLYPAALVYLASDRRVLEEAGSKELAEILGKIDEEGLMAPLQVIEALAGTGSGGGAAKMGMVKAYLRETIRREREEIEANRRRIETLRKDTEQRRADLSDLETKPAVFQATRCAECGQGMDLPAVHFLCKHSFHQRCLGGEAGECPKCSGEREVIRKMREGQRERSERHELFLGDLEASRDRFATIAEWYSRGVMDAEPPRARPGGR